MTPSTPGDYQYLKANVPVTVRRQHSLSPLLFSRRIVYPVLPFLFAITFGAETGSVQTPQPPAPAPSVHYRVLTASEVQSKETIRGQREHQPAADRCDFPAYVPVRMNFINSNPVLKSVQPKYPLEAVERAVQGRVIVRALVDEQGSIKRACAIEGDEILRRAAETAVLRWKLKCEYGRRMVRAVSQKNPKNYADAFIAFDFLLNSVSTETQSRKTIPAAKREQIIDSSFELSSASSNTKLFPVSTDSGPLSRVGFINSSGTLVIDFKFYSADPFSEGLARVTLMKDGKEGYINATGQVVIEPKFERAFPFKERRAKVRLNGKWGYIDPAGTIIVEPKFEEADSFYEGRARVKLAGKWGYIDPSGKLVIPALFDGANRFSEGLACVLKNNRLGYVDRSGVWVIRAQFERLSSPTDALFLPNFKEGLAVAKQGGQYGYIDKSGQFVIPAYFDRAESFSERLAPITIQKKVGYITRKGAIAFTPQFDVAGQFSEGMAQIAINHKWGFIDSTGKIVIQPQFDLVMPFTDGLAYASVGRTSGYIDKRGKWVWVTNWE